LSLSNQVLRGLWSVVWLLLYRPSPPFLHGWRRFLLRGFGATVGRGAHPYPRCRIWAPWNLTMGDHSGMANDVDCYSVAPITLGAHSTVSQHAHLCAGTHDYQDPEFRLIPKAIHVDARAWVAAGAFIGPGVTVGEGSVVGARAVVSKDVDPWTVVAGNPAVEIKKRIIKPRGGVISPTQPTK